MPAGNPVLKRIFAAATPTDKNTTVLSIEAVLNPDKTNYFYFVADKNKKTYFASTYKEHTQIVAKLRKDGLWYEY